MAQDTNLGTEAATRYLPEDNLGTRATRKVFKSSLINGSLLNQGCRVRVHTGWVLQFGAYFKLPRIRPRQQSTFPGYSEHSLAVLETSVPMVKLNYLSTGLDLFVISCSISTLYRDEDTSTSSQCLSFYSYFISRWGTVRGKTGQCDIRNS